MNQNERDMLKKVAEECANKLAEHCDTVQIFCTLQVGEDQETVCVEEGRGNFYARQGQVDEWLRIQQQYQRNWAIRKDAESE